MGTIVIVTLAACVGAAVAVTLTVSVAPRVQGLVPRAWLEVIRSWGGPYTPSWRGVQKRILRRMTPVLGVNGARQVAVSYEVRLSPEDIAVAGDRVAEMEHQLVRALKIRARKHDWRVPSNPTITIAEDPNVVEGFPEVRSHLTRSLSPTEVESASARRPSSAHGDVGGTAVQHVAVLPDGGDLDGTSWMPEVSRTDVDTTVTRKLVLTLEPVADGLSSVPECGHTVTLVAGSAVSIGRASGARIRLSDPHVSSRHATLTYDSERNMAVVTDVGSTNGTLIDGTPVAKTADLVNGARLQLGRGGPSFVVGTRQ